MCYDDSYCWLEYILLSGMAWADQNVDSAMACDCVGMAATAWTERKLKEIYFGSREISQHACDGVMTDNTCILRISCFVCSIAIPLPLLLLLIRWPRTCSVHHLQSNFGWCLVCNMIQNDSSFSMAVHGAQAPTEPPEKRAEIGWKG